MEEEVFIFIFSALLLGLFVGILVVNLFRHFSGKKQLDVEDYTTYEDIPAKSNVSAEDVQEKERQKFIERAHNIILTLCAKIALCDYGDTNLKLNAVREKFSDTPDLSNKINIIKANIHKIDIVECAKDAVDVYNNSEAYLTIIRDMYDIAMADGLSAEEELKICEVAEVMNIRPSVQEAVKNEIKQYHQ